MPARPAHAGPSCAYSSAPRIRFRPFPPVSDPFGRSYMRAEPNGARIATRCEGAVRGTVRGYIRCADLTPRREALRCQLYTESPSTPRKVPAAAVQSQIS